MSTTAGRFVPPTFDEFTAALPDDFDQAILAQTALLGDIASNATLEAMFDWMARAETPASLR